LPEGGIYTDQSTFQVEGRVYLWTAEEVVVVPVINAGTSKYVRTCDCNSIKQEAFAAKVPLTGTSLKDLCKFPFHIFPQILDPLISLVRIPGSGFQDNSIDVSAEIGCVSAGRFYPALDA
jgi:hypothetical protein